jgi:hypothetical protein
VLTIHRPIDKPAPRMGRRLGLLTSLALALAAAITQPTLRRADAAEVRAACAEPGAAGLAGTPLCIAEPRFNEDVCAAIERLARVHGLPEGFFARLIWQESRFDPNAVSPAGAEGIAQFIPSTARLRRLADPFNPAMALARSAEYLAEMRDAFGNLGMAAIGYNAGENRARAFLAGNGFMPGETRAYVRIITGHSVENWRDDEPQTVDFDLAKDKDFKSACLDLAANSRMTAFRAENGAWKPWGVQLGAGRSRDAAERVFERVQARHAELAGESALYVRSRAQTTVRVGRDTRAESQALCQTIRGQGGFCLVVRN